MMTMDDDYLEAGRLLHNHSLSIKILSSYPRKRTYEFLLDYDDCGRKYVTGQLLLLREDALNLEYIRCFFYCRIHHSLQWQHNHCQRLIVHIRTMYTYSSMHSNFLKLLQALNSEVSLLDSCNVCLLSMITYVRYVKSLPIALFTRPMHSDSGSAKGEFNL